jgi:hypothetical protein
LFAHSILTYHFFFHRFLGFRNYCVRVLLTSKKSRVPFHRCLIFKVHALQGLDRSLPRDSFDILAHHSTFVNPFFHFFLHFFLPFLAFVYPPGCFCGRCIFRHYILYGSCDSILTH